MAATITGTFVIIDRATGPMKRMESQAQKTMRAIEDVGKAQDRSTGRDTERSYRRTEDAMKGVERQAKQTTRTFSDMDREHKKLSGSNNTLLTSLGKLGAGFAGLRAIMVGLKFGAIAVGVTTLAQAIGTLAGGAAALVPALVSAARAAAALPATIGAAIQGMLSFKLATGGVAEAIKAGMTLQTQAGRNAQDYALMQEQAAQRIQGAERTLFLAQRASTDAQRNLTEARRQARRELVDMTLAAQGAALAERRSQLAVREARRNLARTMIQPGATSLDIASARLGVQEAQLSAREARIQRGRTRADAARTKQRGVEGNPNVRSARQGLSDAIYNQTQATQELARAQRDANRQLAQGTPAMDGYRQAMKDLSPSAQRFVRQIVGMRKGFIDLRNAGAEELFPRLSNALDRLTKLGPTVRRVFTGTSRTIGVNAERAANRLTTPERIGDIGNIGEQQRKILDRLLRGLTNVGEGFIDIMVAARPFTDWLTKTILGWTRMWQETQKVNRASGLTAQRLDKTKEVLKKFFDIASNVWGTLRGIGRAATPLGDKLWTAIDKVTRRWKDWSNSVVGQTEMREWFNKLETPIRSMAGLVGDIAKAWARLTVRKEFTDSIDTLRKAVPGIEKLMGNVSSMGPTVASILAQLSTLLGNLPLSPIKLLLDTLDRILQIVNWLVKHIPGLGTVLSAILVAGAIRTGLTLVTRIVGKWAELFTMWRTAPRPPNVAPPASPGTGGTPYIAGEPPASPGTPGRLGRFRGRLAGRFPRTAGGLGRIGAGVGKFGRFAGGPAGLAASLAAMVGGDALTQGGHAGAGGALSGAGTGAAIGATVGSIIPGVGTGVGAVVGGIGGGVLGFLHGRQKGRDDSRARGANIAVGLAQHGGIDRLRAQQGHLQRRLAQRHGAIRDDMGHLVTGPGLAVTGGARSKAKDELSAVNQALGALETTQGQQQAGSLQQIYGVYQGGGAAQRRRGRGVVAKTFKEEFEKAGPAGRRALSNNVGQWISVLSKGDKSQRRMARTMTAAVKDAWGGMGRHISVVNGQILGGSQKEWGNIQTALSDPVETAKQDVTKGFTDMQKAAIGSLTSMGYTRAQARRIVRGMEAGGTSVPTGNKLVDANTKASQTSGTDTMTATTGHSATGSRIPGTGLHDNVAVAPGQMAAPGELIVNRHTERRVNQMLGGKTTLGAEVAGEHVPHYSPAILRAANGRYTNDTYGGRVFYAEGGRIVDIPGQPGEKIFSPILPALSKLIEQYHLRVTDGLGGSPPHAPNSDHLWGGAVDVVPGAGGSWEMVDKLAAWAEPKQNQPRFPFRWVGYNGDPGHGRGNHLHLSWSRGHYGLPGGAQGDLSVLGDIGAAQHITAARTRQGGLPGAIGNNALAAIAAGFNKRIDAAGGGGGGTGDLSNFSGGGNATANQQLGRRMMLAAGFGEDQWSALKTLWTGESGWNHLIANKSSGAYGIPQALPGSKMASEGADWRTNPATQIAWGLKYIKERYKSPSGALSAWNSRSPHWYSTGGRMNWAGWNAAGGNFSVNSPTLFGAGESGAEDVTIRPKGKGGGDITVHIERIDYRQKGDVRDAIREEMGMLAEDLGMVGKG